MTGYDQNDLTEDDNNKTINLNVGSVVTIRLSSNPTTGFTWIREGLKGTELSDEIFEIQSSFSRQPHTQQKRPGQHLIVGAGGTMVLNVKALKAGSHTLSLGYGRPWVGFDAVGRQFTLKFKVSQ